MALCVFCGKPGSSEEDVFAKWMKGVVPGEGDFRLTRRHGRSKTNLRYFGVTSRAACRSCNNEWMSRFEETVKPIITPIIRGEPLRWSRASDQVVVARWAFKTALMFDRTHPPRQQTVPAKEFEYLYAHRKPPYSATISLGHYVPAPSEEFFAAWGGTAWTGRGQPLPTGGEFDGYRVTFNVGHAIFQTYGQTGPDLNIRAERGIWIGDERVEDAFRQLWPLTYAPHEWPPRGFRFDSRGLHLLEHGGE